MRVLIYIATIWKQNYSLRTRQRQIRISIVRQALLSVERAACTRVFIRFTSIMAGAKLLIKMRLLKPGRSVYDRS